MEERAVQLIRERLRSIALGALAVLDSLSFATYRVDFATLLLRDPQAAYKVLLAYQRSPHKARLLLRSILLPFAQSATEVLEAIDALEKGDPEPLKQLINRLKKG
ncbi:hypothetical protein CF15_07400 [Pyrodictium occultum]|uniref:Uncharacterized protein n=1 Tax=Pyrodictium occultum TaxID=2309 RepID=A0A0V8RWT7_PYROC|nr:hypothetical protein [Pyrodictium occultum]KSW12537.1 hypothetical protein CF15_07400 [Pyrodictium occultum]